MATDTITFSSEYRDSETVVSNHSTFRFGFFSPVNSTGRYAGIWFNNIPVQTVVWVANRNSPINDSSGMVAISKEGNLVVMDSRGQVHWSTNVSVPVAANTTYARLLNTGNLVLLGTTNSGDDIIWESFEHPQNIYLPTMRLATDAKTGRSLKLRSWKSPSDPSPGRYSAGLIPLPFPELVVWKDDLLMWRSGPWNGQYFIGLPNMDYRINLFELTLSSDNRGSVSMTYAGNTLLYHFLLDSEGSVFQRDWNLAMQEWKTWLKVPSTKCDTYATCGQFASCKFNYGSTPPCMCIRGFKPQSYAEWKNGNWTQGCVRKAPLQCERRDNNDGSRKSDRFVRVQKMKVPHNPQRSGANEQDCPGSCLKNCSCTAYSFDRGIGCLLWSGNLMDMQEFSGTGAVFYIRLADSEFSKCSINLQFSI